MANKRTIGHETENITLTLHKYASLNDLVADTQTPPQLDPFVKQHKYVGSSTELGVPDQLTLSDLRINKEYGYSLRLGENTWAKVDIYSRFGIPVSLWVNEDILSEKLPWTVWLHEPREDEKYGRYAVFCGYLFKTEAEAQAWVDANIPPSVDEETHEEANTDSISDAEQ